MNNLKIGSRIALLSAAPIIGIAVLGAVYVAGEQTRDSALTVAEKFDQAKHSLDEIARGVDGLNRELMSFILMRDQESLRQFNEIAEGTLTALKELEGQDVVADVAEVLGQFKAAVPGLVANARDVIQQRQAAGLSSNEGAIGELNAAEAELLDLATRINNAQVMQKVKDMQDVMNVYMVTEINQKTVDPETEVKTHAAEKEKTVIQLEALDKEIESLLDASVATEQDKANFDAQIHEFKHAFSTWVDAKGRIDQALSKQETILQVIEQSLTNIEKRSEEMIAKTNAVVENTRSWTYKAAALTAAGVAAIVLLISLLMGRSILRPLRNLTNGFTKLASGSLDIVIDGLDRKDEFGDLVRAAEVFRSNALERNRLEAEAKASMERDLARTAELQQAERRFQEELTEVVSAAARGDFSRRVDVSGMPGFTAKLGEGLNHWAETVSKVFSEIESVTSAMASGDLSRSMEGSFEGDLERLQTNVNAMGEQMRKIAGRIAAATGAVQHAAYEIGSGVLDLSGRTEQQASSLEETAASMEELSATVRQNAENAQEANQLAASARQLAMGGGEIASRAVSAMDKIETSSREIAHIVGLIQEIAFQTNILALNAAVEAARAGEAGRGFAVVANEVRALAQRSGQASKDIKELIGNTDTTVKEGVELVKQAGTSLTEIVTAVRKVADIVSEIAAASQEQSSGIEQVTKAVGNMDEMTQRNAALVEETNAALQSAQTQVEELRQAVSFFKSEETAVSTEGKSPIPAKATEQAGDNRQMGELYDKLSSLTKRLAPYMASRGNTAVAAEWKEF